MQFQGHLDEVEEGVVHGWAYCPDIPDIPMHVDIVFNHQLVKRAIANVYRHDLRTANIGDGYKAYWFNPLDHWHARENLIEVFFSGTDQLVHNGRQRIVVSFDESIHDSAQSRWRGDESDESLTWGQVLGGETFVREVENWFQFTPETTVLEIGPGYGRLLKTLLGAGHKFSGYLGLDLSPARIAKLKDRFGLPRIDFMVGNILEFTTEKQFDLILSSATFEHLYPSIAKALAACRRALSPGGMIFVDFIARDDRLGTSRAYIEHDCGGAFIRIYSRDEMTTFFTEAGFTVLEIVHPVVLGLDVAGTEIHRALVVARR